MLRRTFIAGAASAPLLLLAPAVSPPQVSPTASTPAQEPAMKLNPSKTGYAPVNGLKLYYEVYGAGEPLVLLHGGVGSIEMLMPLLPALAQVRQVIAVDLQAHGRTADIDRPLRYESMADDIADLLKQLHIEQADVMGYSLGGGTALQIAIRHPQRVRSLVLVSTPYARAGWFPEIRAAMAQMGPGSAEAMKQSPLYENYRALAPRLEDWPVLHTKLQNLLTQDYDWSAAVAALKARTLLVVGDADAISIAHTAAFFELLGGGKKDADWDGSGMGKARLAILPGVTHYNSFASPLLATAAVSFLNGSMPGPK